MEKVYRLTKIPKKLAEKQVASTGVINRGLWLYR
jgi:hypothetical protein